MSDQRAIDADRPIESWDENRLSRSRFAQALARQIRTAPVEHGFALALNGPWGSGKTSVLNLIALELDEHASDAVCVVNYNPWLFRTAGDLLDSFFSALSAEIGTSRSKSLKGAAESLAQLGASLASVAGAPGGRFWSTLIARLPWGTTTRSARDRYEEAKQRLRGADQRVIVMVDDIDRLDDEEVRELFRLIRLLSDLPNTVFLLSFDQTVVERQLTSRNTNGAQYLAKFLQVAYDLPLVDPAVVTSLLTNAIDGQVEDAPHLELDSKAWQEIYFEIVRPCVTTARDLKRFVNAIPVVFELVGDEIALADLLAIEAVRTNRNRLFQLLRSNAEALVRHYNPARFELPEMRDKRIRPLLDSVRECSGAEPELVDAIYRLLFPATQGPLGRSSYGEEWEANWGRDRRLATASVLRTYVELTLRAEELGYQEVRQLLDAVRDRERLAALLDQLDSAGVKRAFERLEDFDTQYPADAILTAVPVIANRMGGFEAQSGGFLGFSARRWATRILYRLLRRIGELPEPGAAARDTLAEIDELSARFEIIEQLGHRPNVGHELIGEELSRSLEDEFVDDFVEASNTDLAAEWNLGAIVLRCSDWDAPANQRLTSRMQSALSDNAVVLNLIRTLRGEASRS